MTLSIERNTGGMLFIDGSSVGRKLQKPRTSPGCPCACWCLAGVEGLALGFRFWGLGFRA